MAFYKMHINVHNKTAHHILKNEVGLILPKFPKGRKSKRGIFSTIIIGFVGLAFEGISSFLHNRRHKALHKAVQACHLQQTYKETNMHFRRYFSYVWSL